MSSVRIQRALLSVSDKTGLAELGKALHERFGVELISTGGTATFLRKLGLPVTDVSAITGFAEMMDGRVKTLHPNIHGGLLARRDLPQHMAALEAHGMRTIDLVCVNLYPFAQTIAKADVGFEEAIENIDIGGPSMIRSAAKNHAAVTVLTSPDQYQAVLTDLSGNGGASTPALRLELARAAFAHTGQYDTMIAGYLGKQTQDAEPLGLPENISLDLMRLQTLRYGENPHQQAALYIHRHAQPNTASVAQARQLHGKELSYINLLDADAALACASEFEGPAACIVKHATPCGVAVAANMADAFAAAYACDPLAAFGGIVAFNRPVDIDAARQIVDGQKFLEVIVAPAYSDDALNLLKDRWKNVRLLATTEPSRPGIYLSMRQISGGFLVQQSDSRGGDAAAWRVVSKRQPRETEWIDLKFAWLACKHVKSNAIVIARNGATVGIGGGQVDRVGAAAIALQKAADRSAGAVAASDAFFPFADGPQKLLAAGVSAIIQPGGSVRDAESIAAVDAAGGVMVFTGERHFRH